MSLTVGSLFSGIGGFSSISDLNGPECEPSGSASKTSSAPESSTTDGPECPSSMTSTTLTGECQESMFSVEDFPASQSAPPAKGSSRQTNGGSGLSSPESFASYDPDGSCWRTSQLCLDGDLEMFSGTFPRAGMTRSGIAFRLQPLAPLTGGTGSGLLPTPAARDWKFSGVWPTPRASKNENRQTKPTPSQLAGKHGMNLSTAVNLWPTPKATDADRGGRGDLLQRVRGNESPSGHFKTPTAAPFSHGGSGGELHKQVAASGGPLNPQWVAWLMGFPIDWTSLPPSETLSSRKSPSGSAVES